MGIDLDPAHFSEHGWAVIRGAIEAAEARELAELSEGSYRQQQRRGAPREASTYAERVHGQLTQPSLDGGSNRYRQLSFSHRLGSLAARLLDVPRVRFFRDVVLVKAGSEDSLPTPIHQDLPHWPFDRSAALTFWIALREVTPEMGPLRFFDGSHRWGVLGQHTPPSTPLEDRHPHLREVTPTTPPVLMPGDATVHSCLTVHGAGANQTTTSRWAWVISYVDADVVYTGQRSMWTDGLDLRPNSLLDHERFPIAG